MATTSSLVVFTTCHPWIQDVVGQVRPDGFDVEFLDLNDESAVAETLPRADFVVCLSLTPGSGGAAGAMQAGHAQRRWL